MTKMNIEVGEYVRTEIGTIGKVVRINEIYFTIENNRGEIDVLYEGNQKHSRNIIDLIETGDYVNGYKVRGKTNERVVLDYYYYSEELCDGYWVSMKEKDIYSIVTKEQFNNMEYRL